MMVGHVVCCSCAFCAVGDDMWRMDGIQNKKEEKLDGFASCAREVFYVHQNSRIHNTYMWKGKNRDGSCSSEVAIVCGRVVVVCLIPKYCVLFKGFPKCP